MICPLHGTALGPRFRGDDDARLSPRFRGDDDARLGPRFRGDDARLGPRLRGDDSRCFDSVRAAAEFAHRSFDQCFAAAATTFCAASAMLFAVMIGSPDCASNAFPCSSFVPFMRTTSGTLSDTARDAAMTPSAITSQRMMPPKMLTRIAFRSGLRSMILNASVTFSADAPPPTSRKLAGLPP